MKRLYQLIITACNNIQNNAGRMHRFNPISFACNHLVGKDHTHLHRIIVGIPVIVLGVAISKYGIGLSGPIHIMLDGIGYLVHGIGAIPFIEIVDKWSRRD